MLLSVLIPSLAERPDSLCELLKVLHKQKDPELEVLCITDSRTWNLGVKRNTLIQMAKGKFIANIDDDDLVAPDYFASIKDALRKDVDLVAYNATCIFNGSRPFTVFTGMDFENEQPQHIPGGYSDIKRKPWHWCAWRRDLALQCKFPEGNDQSLEDWTFLSQALPRVKTWRKVEKALYVYRYSVSGSCF